MVPDGPRVVNMTVASDRSVNIRCGVAPFAPARRQLVQDVMGLLHPLLGLDVRGSGLPGRAFDGSGHRRDVPERIERYMKLFEKEDVKKLQTGKWVWIEKDEWKLIPD